MFRTIIYFLLLCMALTACRHKRPHERNNGVETSVEKIMSIGEIEKIEKVIADSTLMGADGDVSWKKHGKNMIRVKIGDQYYLRVITKEGTVTNLTYRYDN